MNWTVNLLFQNGLKLGSTLTHGGRLLGRVGVIFSAGGVCSEGWAFTRKGAFAREGGPILGRVGVCSDQLLRLPNSRIGRTNAHPPFALEIRVNAQWAYTRRFTVIEH